MRKKSYFSNVVKRFTHWSHKGYGLFESFRTVVSIGVLPLSYCLLAMPMATFAQPDSVAVTKNVDIEEVVVNACKKASTYSELTRVVRVVSRDELGQHGAIALGELLEQVAAIDIRQRGAHGVQADINFRGGTFDQVMVLLNGVNITDPQTGHHNLNIPINIDAVERIEILQGPGAREYGAGAFAGAINIITRPDSTNRGKFSVFTGEHGLLKLSVAQNLSKKEKLKTFAAASYDRSDGYIENTDFRNLNVFLHTTGKLAGGEVFVFAGYQDKAFGANSFYTPKYPNQYEVTKAMLGSVGYEHTWGYSVLRANGYYRKHSDKFELFRTNPPLWYTSHNYHTTDVFGAKISGSRFFSWGKADVGLEIRHEEILSNKLGTALKDSVKVWGENIYYKKGDSRNHLIAFTTQSFFLGDLAFSVGGQYNHSNKYGDIWTWGADFSYGLSRKVRPFASVNHSFRLPTFTDLYYQGPTNLGNPNLKAEFATTYETGVKLHFNRWIAEFAGFYRQGNDIIDWVKPANETVWTTVNYTKLNTWGGSVNVTANVKEYGIFTDKLSLSYTYAYSEKGKAELDSYYVLDYLVHNLSLNAYHSIYRGLYLNWTIRYQDRNGEYLRYIDAGTSVPTKYPSTWIVDARVGYSTPKINIYADSRNLFNHFYVDIANVRQPGRWLGIGFNYSFD